MEPPQGTKKRMKISLATESYSSNHVLTDGKYEEAKEEEWSLAKELKQQGIAAAEAGNMEEALVHWDNALRIDGSLAEVHEMKAQALMELARYFPAIQAAEAACELRPEWECGFVTLGRAQLNFGEPAMALQSFQRALTLNPSLKEIATDIEYAEQQVKRMKDIQQKEAAGAAAEALRSGQPQAAAHSHDAFVNVVVVDVGEELGPNGRSVGRQCNGACTEEL